VKLIRNNTNREDKDCRAVKGLGFPVELRRCTSGHLEHSLLKRELLNWRKEGLEFGPGVCKVLCRTNHVVDEVQKELQSSGIQCTLDPSSSGD
jgi:superfamily I DNA/RNA helicase